MELTDRELIIKLESRIERLSDSIDRLGEGLRDMEEKKLHSIETDVAELKNWKAQINGGWKLAIGVWVAITFLLSLLLKNFIK